MAPAERCHESACTTVLADDGGLYHDSPRSWCGQSLGWPFKRLPLAGPGTSGTPGHVAQLAVAPGELRVALRRGAVAAAARRAHEDLVAAGEDVLAAVVDGAAVQTHV